MTDVRNLSDKCKYCVDNSYYSLSQCMDACGVPLDILKAIEEKRNVNNVQKENS